MNTSLKLALIAGIFLSHLLFTCADAADLAPADSPVHLRTMTLREGVDLQEYRLPNGLTVVLTRNPRAPLTSIYHWVKAGSLHESPGVTGIAHLFEHMMFRPLAPDAPGFWELTAKMGARANANTRFGSTVYTTTVPDGNLKAALELEADRFQKLRVTDALLDVERKAVWSEYSTKMDSNPIIDLWDAVYRSGFPGHPYGWMIIGERDDLEKIEATDCNRFFDRYYRPGNVGLFVSGNIEPDAVIGWIADLYGGWEAGEASSLPKPFSGAAGPILAEGKLPSTAGNVLIGFRTPEYDGKNHHLQALANHILFGAEHSLAKRRLLHRLELVSEVSDFNFDYDQGMMKVFATRLPGVPRDRITAEILSLVGDFADLDSDEYTAYLRDYQIGVAENLQRNESLNQSLALSWGKFDDLTARVEEARQPLNLDKKPVLEFLQTYVTADNMVAVTNRDGATESQGSGGEAATESNASGGEAATESNASSGEAATESNASSGEAATESNASSGEAATESKGSNREAAARRLLSTGAPFEAEGDEFLPRELVLITFPGGAGSLPRNVQGLTGILEEIFNEGPAGMDSTAYRETLFKLNASIDLEADARTIQVVVSAPGENLERALQITSELIRSPHLDAKTFALAKNRVAANVKTTFEDMRSVIMYVSRRQVFDHHRDTLDGSGSPRSIGNVDLESVKKHLPSLFDFSRTFYHAAGPVNPKAVEQALEKTLLKTFPDAYREYVFEGIDPDAHRSGDLVVTIINKVGATDTQVFWVHPESISMDTPERAVADLAHAVMGGGLSGRLGKTLRTERGLTYHASSGYSPTLPMWVVYSFAGDEQLPQLLAGIPEVIEAFRGEDLTAKEIEENAQKMTTDFKNGRELALQRLMERVQYRIRGWDTRHIETYLDNLAAVTPDAIESFADRKIENAGGYLFLMGDATKVGKAIEDSGLPATSVKIIQMDEID